MLSWMTITNLGGSAVMMPAAAVCAAWLVFARAWRMAFWWCLLFSAGMTLVAASKIAFIGWGIGIQSLDFTGFSGHAMRATAVMPVLFYLLLQKKGPLARTSGVALGIAFGVIIGVSRLVVHAHSVSEAVSGCVLGCMVSLGFIWSSSTSPNPVFHRWLIALSLITLIPAPMAEPVPAEQWLEAIALRLSGHDKPFGRIKATSTNRSLS
jgi:hypothetical protein